MQPVSEETRKAADTLRIEGNTLFSKAKYGAAMDRYTEAITLCPDNSILYVNRAMCHKKKGDMASAAKDAANALDLDKDNMKAHYLLGSYYCEVESYQQAVSHLQKALEAAREKNDSIKDEIWRQLALAKYNQWQRVAAERSQARNQLRCLLHEFNMPVSHPNNRGSVESVPPLPHQVPSNKIKEVNASTQQVDEVVRGLNDLLNTVTAYDTPKEVPSTYVCPLTMEVFRDPVITPAGHSYERSALLDHLQKLGKWDPISRNVPVREKDLIPNLGLRAAVQNYLDEHPYAWAECR